MIAGAREAEITAPSRTPMRPSAPIWITPRLESLFRAARKMTSAAPITGVTSAWTLIAVAPGRSPSNRATPLSSEMTRNPSPVLVKLVPAAAYSMKQTMMTEEERKQHAITLTAMQLAFWLAVVFGHAQIALLLYWVPVLIGLVSVSLWLKGKWYPGSAGEVSDVTCCPAVEPDKR